MIRLITELVKKTYFEIGKTLTKEEKMSKIINQSTITSKFTLPDQTIVENEVQSNTTETENMTLAFLKNRTTAKNFGLQNDEIQQTLHLQNNSDFSIENIHITDTIGEGLSFKTGSVTIDSTPYENFNILDGFDLPSSLQSNGSVTISYLVSVNENVAVASAELFSTISYSVNSENFQEQSNTNEIEIIIQELIVQKSVDKQVAISGDHLKFTHILRNEGRLPFTNIVFYDPLPQGVRFIENSVKINNETKIGYNPQNKFSVEDILPTNEITIVFDVEVE